MGRPSLLSTERADRIVEVTAAGGTLAMCADAIGMASSTIKSWLAKGTAALAAESVSPDDLLFVDLVIRVGEARAALFQRAVSVVVEAFDNDPAMALKFLERRAPEDWAPANK